MKLSYSEKRFRREVHFLKLLQGKILIPKLLHAVDPKKDFKGAILMQFLDGELLDNTTLNREICLEIGAELAKIHSINVASFGELHTSTPKAYKNNFDEYESYFLRSLGEMEKHFEESLIEGCRKLFEKLKPSLDELDGPCLVHRDYKLSNILFKKRQFQGLIDFENMKGSFAEEDFALIDFLTFDRRPELKKYFTDGYSSIRELPNLNTLEFFKFCRALGFLGFAIERKVNNKYKKYFNTNFDYINSLILNN